VFGFKLVLRFSLPPAFLSGKNVAKAGIMVVNHGNYKNLATRECPFLRFFLGKTSFIWPTEGVDASSCSGKVG
jgi:hypothetical protein